MNKILLLIALIVSFGFGYLFIVMIDTLVAFGEALRSYTK